MIPVGMSSSFTANFKYNYAAASGEDVSFTGSFQPCNSSAFNFRECLRGCLSKRRTILQVWDVGNIATIFFTIEDS